MPRQPTLPTAERLLELVDTMDGKPVLMVVDIVADVFITGTPKRISREAPVLILSHESERVTPGGGANAVANVAALGGRPLPVGIVGDDEAGGKLLEIFEQRGIAADGIVRSAVRTPTKVRILGGGRHAIRQQIVRYDIEPEHEPTTADREAMSSAMAAVRGRAEVAVISDYGYGAAHPSTAAAARDGLGGGGTIVVDSRSRLGDFTGIEGATPNEEEAEALHGGPLGDGADLLAAGRGLLERLHGRFLLLTRGSLGMSLFDEAGAAHLPVHGTDQVADVTGAGDTVIGAFALALAAGATPLEAALLADYASGVVVMKVGTATLTSDELREAIRLDERPLTRATWESY